MSDAYPDGWFPLRSGAAPAQARERSENPDVQTQNWHAAKQLYLEIFGERLQRERQAEEARQSTFQ